MIARKALFIHIDVRKLYANQKSTQIVNLHQKSYQLLDKIQNPHQLSDEIQTRQKTNISNCFIFIDTDKIVKFVENTNTSI